MFSARHLAMTNFVFFIVIILFIYWRLQNDLNARIADARNTRTQEILPSCVLIALQGRFIGTI